jgi:NADH-quinone oxidoreductase subunit A
VYVLALAVLLLAGAVYGVASLVRVGRTVTNSRPFLSGHEPVEHALSRYHVRWYTVTMLFLAFDMEMVFMYPWTLVVASMGAAAVVEMFVFLAILFAGVVYAWREGALRWT